MEGEDRAFLATMLRGRGGEDATHLADESAAHPQPARLVEEGPHVTAHVAEAGGGAEDDCVVVGQLAW